MDSISVIRQQFQGAHGLVEATMQGVTQQQAHWAPPGTANPLGATYAHVVIGEDSILNRMARGAQPLSETTWAGKLGLSEPPPGQGGDLAGWSRRVQVELPALQKYAQAVYANTDEWLASLKPEDLQRPVDLSGFGLGQQNLAFLVAGIMLQHANNHCGEISCLKGLQGAKGYPF